MARACLWAARPLLLALTAALLPVCLAGGRVFFPGPSIGPAPPVLWQSLNSLRQARRLNDDSAAPELRAAGVRIGQKYSDIEKPPPLLELQSQPQQNGQLRPLDDGEPQPGQHGSLESLGPLGPLNILDPLEIRFQSDIDLPDNSQPLQADDVNQRQNSEHLQSLAPLPVFAAVEPRGRAEFSDSFRQHQGDDAGSRDHNPGGFSDPHPDDVIPLDAALDLSRPGRFNLAADRQNRGEFVSAGSFQQGSSDFGSRNPIAGGFSDPDQDDVITLDEAADLSKPEFRIAHIPEGVVFAASTVEDANFNGEPSGDLRLPSGVLTLPQRQDLQSSASVLDSTSVEQPAGVPPFRLPLARRDRPGAGPPTIAVAQGPLPSDQNLLNLLVTQGVLRPVGRVRVARLRLVTDEDKQEEEADRDQSSAFFTPSAPGDGESIVELDAEEQPFEETLDERKRHNENPRDDIHVGFTEHVHPVLDEREDDTEVRAPASDETEQLILESNIVPVLSEKEVFGQLVTPRASGSNTIVSTDSSGATGSNAPEPVSEESESAEPTVEDAEGQKALPEGVAEGGDGVPVRSHSLAARLTELNSRVSRQGPWGTRLSSLARRRTRPAEDSQQDGWQDSRRNSWQRRVDVGEPVFVSTDNDEAPKDLPKDLDTEASERHEEVASLDDSKRRLLEAESIDEESPNSLSEVESPGQNVAELAASQKKAQTLIDILTERTANFREKNSTEDAAAETGPPELTAEMHGCPQLGGSVTLECRVKNAPQDAPIKRFWWMRRHFDGEQGAARDELLAVNGVSKHSNSSSSNSSNIHVDQVAAGHQRLTVRAVAAADTGLYMCQVGWRDTLREAELLVFLCP